ncbi:Membrane-associated lipoprotein precursor, partial [Mycoplasma putrefaciens]
MDYQLENNPTTFYFGTNSHVAKALTNKLTAVSITRIKESVKVGQKLMLNSFDKNFETFTFNIDDKNRGSVSAIFHATDFISKKPSDYLVKEQAKKYKDAGFFADFAVIEFDFKKLLSNDNLSVMSGREPLNNYKNQSVQELAKIITNNYANKENKQVKFKSDSYLTEYKKIDRPILIENEEEFNKLENLYILGYPTSEGDYYLKKYEDDTQIIEKKHDFSLW